MVGTEKWVSQLTSSSMFFKLHLWDMVSGVQVRFIPFYSSRNPWCDLLAAKAYISPAPLSWNVFFRITVLTLHFMPALKYVSPLHLSCGACWNKHLFIFKGQASVKGLVWHLLAAEGVGVHRCPIAGYCFSSLCDCSLVSSSKGVGTGWGPVWQRGSEDQALRDSRGL